jgi:hypothetical protein
MKYETNKDELKAYAKKQAKIKIFYKALRKCCKKLDKKGISAYVAATGTDREAGPFATVCLDFRNEL